MGVSYPGPTTPTQFLMPTGICMEKILAIGNFEHRSAGDVIATLRSDVR